MSRPPATRPMAPPAAETVVNSPMAFTLAAPSGKMVVSRARPAGAARAPPAPCRARAASSIQLAVASPPASELKVNRAIPAKKVRRRPSRSPERAPSRSRPPKVSTYAFNTHESEEFEKPRLRWMWGRATLTMVASSTTISWAVRMTAEDYGGMAAPPALPSPEI